MYDRNNAQEGDTTECHFIWFNGPVNVEGRKMNWSV